MLRIRVFFFLRYYVLFVNLLRRIRYTNQIRFGREPNAFCYRYA